MSQLSTSPSQVTQLDDDVAPGGITTYTIDCRKWLNPGEAMSAPSSYLWDQTASEEVTIDDPAVGANIKQLTQTIENSKLTAGHVYTLYVTAMITASVKAPTCVLIINCPTP